MNPIITPRAYTPQNAAMLDRQELELEKRLEKSNLKAIKENDNSKLIDKKNIEN